jgi:hypothetical protein
MVVLLYNSVQLINFLSKKNTFKKLANFFLTRKYFLLIIFF